MQLDSQSVHQILSGDHKQGALWLGDYQSATNLNFLSKNQIRTVITVASDLPISYNNVKIIKHIVYQIEDRVTANISQYFDSSIQQIDIGRKIGNVLVHCLAGISRSATIVIAYIMYTNGWSLTKSMMYVKLKRSQIQPNEGFLIQLRQQDYCQNNRFRIQRNNLEDVQHKLILNGNRMICFIILCLNVAYRKDENIILVLFTILKQNQNIQTQTMSTFGLNHFMNIPMFQYAAAYPFKYQNQYQMAQQELFSKNKQETEENTKSAENTYKSELFQWVKKQNINELVVNSKTITTFIIRMYFHDTLIERSNYALDEKTNKFPTINDEQLSNVCLVRKRRNHDEDEEKLILEQKLLQNLYILDQDQLFDTFCLKGSLEEILNLLVECSNGLAFSSQPKVNYDNSTKQYTVHNAIWFNPNTYQTCSGWIINECEKAVALLYYKHSQGYTSDTITISEFSQYWTKDNDGLKQKINNQIPQVCKEFKNAPKKKKTQSEDIQWAQFLFKKSENQQLNETEIISKFQEIKLEEIYYTTISKLLLVQTLCEKRILKIIKDLFKDKIIKDLQQIELKEKIKGIQQVKKTKKKQKKNKTKQQENTPSTSSHKDTEFKTLNLQELIEQLNKMEHNNNTIREFNDTNTKASYFTTPPNSPWNETETKSNYSQLPSAPIQQFPFIDSKLDELEKIENDDNDNDQWFIITSKTRNRKGQRKYSSQIELHERPKKNKIYKSINKQSKQSSIQFQNNNKNTSALKSQMQIIDPNTIASLSSQENDSTEKQNSEQLNLELLNLENQNSEQQKSIDLKDSVEVIILEKVNSDNINLKLIKQQEQQQQQQSQQQQQQQKEEEELDPVVMEQAFNLMIKKLDLDMREMNDQILQQNEQILPIRQLIYNRLSIIVNHIFRDYNANIRLFGSCATGLALPESDIDFGITGFEFFPSAQLCGPINRLAESLQKMKWIKSILPIYSSSMPLLKLQVDPFISFTIDNTSGFILPNIDLNKSEIECNQQIFSVDISFFQFKGPKTYPHLGQISTELTLQWLQFYQELRPLTLLFKNLLKRRGLNDQYKGGISSFCIIQMVLSFLENYYQENKMTSIGHTTYKFLQFYGTQFDPLKIGIEYKGFNQSPFYDLFDFEDQAEITIISPITNEIISQGSSFVQTILQDIQTLFQATQNEIQFFYEKIKFNKKKKGKKEDRNLFQKELNKLTPLFSCTVYKNI